MMFRRAVLVLSLIALYSASFVTTNACGGGSPTPVETILAGRVTDAATQSPIGGATAQIQSGRSTTTAEGFYFVQRLSPGRGTLTVTHEAYQPFETEITLREGNNNRNVELVRR